MPAKKDQPKPEKPKQISVNGGADENVPTDNAGAATAPEVPDKLLKGISTESIAQSDGESVAVRRPEKQSKKTAEKPIAPEGDFPETSTEAVIENAETDKAVDDIAQEESDTMLALQDAAGEEASTPQSGWKAKLKRILKSKWTWLGLCAVIILLFAVPYTRYKLLGIFIKEQVTVTVLDSQAKTPVSNATVSLGGKSGNTSGEGRVTLKVGPGKKTLQVSKQYYKAAKSSYFVHFKASSTKVQLTATGRQIPITVVNTITGQPVAGAVIKAVKTSAKTNSHGQATLVVPAGPQTDSATLTASGYNNAKIAVQVTNQVVPANTFKITPAGYVYFLNNASGTIDVVKAALDGSNQQTVLAGSGNETTATTSLLASRDWHYLVLKARRDAGQPALFLINTSNDKVSEFDGNNAAFTPIGWSGHNFMYEATSNTTPDSQAGHQVIKSYDADRQQLNQLDQSQASNGGSQQFANFYVLNNLLTYTTMWAGNGVFSGQPATIRGIQPDGQNKKDYQQLPADTSSIQAALYQPQAIYYAVQALKAPTAYYNFQNQAVDSVSNVSAGTFSQTHPVYLVSPGGAKTFWSSSQSGLNNLYTGDINAGKSAQIMENTNYAGYGWFTDKYILVSRDHNELFVMPAGGEKSGSQPIKIGNYYQTPMAASDGYTYGSF